MTFMTIAQAAASGHTAAHFFSGFESVDLHWAARREERYLGLYESLDEDDDELARVAILGRIDSQWFAATCLVDGEGDVQDLIGRRCQRTRTFPQLGDMILPAWRAMRFGLGRGECGGAAVGEA